MKGGASLRTGPKRPVKPVPQPEKGRTKLVIVQDGELEIDVPAGTTILLESKRVTRDAWEVVKPLRSEGYDHITLKTTHEELVILREDANSFDEPPEVLESATPARAR
jgi:hypothetical protein